ncbi:MAG: sensor histidine kinase [Gemmatimonadaceae bacterium]
MVILDSLREPIEPLFARNAPMWLRVWALTQLAALVAATTFATRRTGSVAAVFASPSGKIVALALVLLIAWHVAGLLAHKWLVRERWRSIAFVASCFALIVWACYIRREYTFLIFGALLQMCVFLSFAWVAGALVALVLLAVGSVAGIGQGVTNARLINAVPVMMVGVIVGTVVLYIHLSNRHAAVQDDLLRRLDSAQNDLAARAREAGILEERQRLSRDLHDTLAQGFTSVIAQLSAAELVLQGAEPNPGSAPADQTSLAAPYLARAQAVSRASLSEIRRLVLALRPTELSDGPLTLTLDRVVRQWATLHGIVATFGASDVPELVQDAEVTLLRATQEGLGNVARHAAAKNVSVRLSCVDDLVLLEIDDDGRGIREHSNGEDSGGLGLSGMRERAGALGGHVIVENNGVRGTSLTVALPLATVAITPIRAES